MGGSGECRAISRAVIINTGVVINTDIHTGVIINHGVEMNTDINPAAILAPTGVLYVSYFYRTGYLFHSALHQCQNTRSKLQVLRDMGIHECFSTFKHPGLSVPTKQIKRFHATPTPYKTMQYHTKQIPAGNAS